MPKLWGLRCALRMCPCELMRFGKDREELWAVCADCGARRIWMNEPTKGEARK